MRSNYSCEPNMKLVLGEGHDLDYGSLEPKDIELPLTRVDLHEWMLNNNIDPELNACPFVLRFVELPFSLFDSDMCLNDAINSFSDIYELNTFAQLASLYKDVEIKNISAFIRSGNLGVIKDLQSLISKLYIKTMNSAPLEHSFEDYQSIEATIEERFVEKNPLVKKSIEHESAREESLAKHLDAADAASKYQDVSRDCETRLEEAR